MQSYSLAHFIRKLLGGYQYRNSRHYSAHNQNLKSGRYSFTL